MGVEAERIDCPLEVRPALERAFAAQRPYVLAIRIDRSI
jgi:thiamine pyrophosphate-dependent acetolactate synthase large subunit-like protein